MRKAFLCECPVCGNGLIRFWNFRSEIVGLCDECELVWLDPKALMAKPRGKADGSFPGVADKMGLEADWKHATRRDVERAHLDEMVAGYSE
jgi:hypothetical protein